MKKLICLLVFFVSLSVSAEEKTVASPDGRLVVKVTTDEGRVCYSVEYDGQEVLKPSRLGLRTNVGDFTEGLTLKETMLMSYYQLT